MSFGRPVLPPDVGALNDAATSGGNASERTDSSGSKPAGIVVRPGVSAGSTPTTREGLARLTIALHSAGGRREDIGRGVAPRFQSGSGASRSRKPLGRRRHT